MALLFLILAIALCSAASWSVAAVVRAGMIGRCSASLAIPLIATFAVIAWRMLPPTASDPDEGWRIVITALALLWSSTSLLVALPVCFLMEDRYGWRFR